MLNIIRDNVQSLGIKFIVGIVVLVMAFFGVSTYRSQSSNTLVTIDGYEVKIDTYQRAFENAQQGIRAQLGNNAAEYIKTLNLKGRIVQQLTNTALLLKSAGDNGMAVSDKELAHEIYNNPVFRTDERFDVNKYRTSLKNVRTDRLSYEMDLRDELLTRKFMRFIESGALYSQNAIENEFQRFGTEMEAMVMEISPSLYSKRAVPTDDEIKAYYEQNKTSYQQKTQFGIKYFMLGVDDVKSEVIVREKEIEKYYQKHKDAEFSIKTSYHARHILIQIPGDKNKAAMENARLQAEQVYKQLVPNRKAFDVFAKLYSNDPGSKDINGDLGWVEKGTFVPEFEKTVAGMEKNELSKPFLSSMGYHIVELLDRKVGSVQLLEKVREKVKTGIRLNKAKRRLKNRISKLMESPADISFDAMASKEGKEVLKTESFDDSKVLKEIGFSRQLYLDIKTKNEKDKGYFNLPGDQKIIVYEVEQVIAPFVKPLDEIKRQIKYKVTEEKKQKIVREEIAGYTDSVKTADQFDALASKLKLNPVTVKFSLSDEKLPGLRVSADFRMEVFKMSVKQVQAIFDSDRGFLVYLKAKTRKQITEKDKEDIEALENTLRKQKVEILLSGFVTRKQSTVKVEYNMPLLKALNVELDL